jgi:hypothetical protein
LYYQFLVFNFDELETGMYVGFGYIVAAKVISGALQHFVMDGIAIRVLHSLLHDAARYQVMLQHYRVVFACIHFAAFPSTSISAAVVHAAKRCCISTVCIAACRDCSIFSRPIQIITQCWGQAFAA